MKTRRIIKGGYGNPTNNPKFLPANLSEAKNKIAKRITHDTEMNKTICDKSLLKIEERGKKIEIQNLSPLNKTIHQDSLLEGKSLLSFREMMNTNDSVTKHPTKKMALYDYQKI